VVLPAIYSNSAPPPSTHPAHVTIRYRDGAVIQYDCATHALMATLPSGSTATIKADQVTSDAMRTTCTGDLIVQNNLIVNGMSSLNAGMSVLPSADDTPATIQGTLTVTDDVTVHGISLVNHTHPVHAIGSDTGAPT
jgi:phage baseplate assembly protein V